MVHHGVEHGTGIGLDALQHLGHHAAGAHQAPDMLDRLDAAELHEAGAGDRIDGLAGRIGDQMQVMGRHGRPPPARKACAWPVPRRLMAGTRSEEHTSELQSLMRISYAVFCLKKKKKKRIESIQTTYTINTHRL